LSEIHNLSWPLVDGLTNYKIQELFFPGSTESTKKSPDYEYMHKELAKPGDIEYFESGDMHYR
jgi:hypothetical protein